MGISIVPLEGAKKLLKKEKEKREQPSMMFDPNLQQKTPDVGADKPKKKKTKKKKDDDLISVKTGGYLKKRVYGAKLGEKMVADSYKNGKSK